MAALAGRQPKKARLGLGAPGERPTAQQSAFRVAEKKYQWRATRETDLGDVVDCAAGDARLRPVTSGAFAVAGRPGLFVLPGAVDAAAERRLARDAYEAFHRPPAVTNLTALGAAPAAAAPEEGPPDALRWATLGRHYDWTRRAYAADATRPMPPDVAALAAGLAARVGERMVAEAAIVNYYVPGQTMGGHVDDAERDRSKALVSISLGCAAVFLFGGPTRDDPPTALLLRSGDACVLAGPARACYHGVPRILAETCPPRLADPAAWAADDPPPPGGLRAYLAGHRINVNVREVGGPRAGSLRDSG